jgi:hypothetical protein
MQERKLTLDNGGSSPKLGVAMILQRGRCPMLRPWNNQFQLSFSYCCCCWMEVRRCPASSCHWCWHFLASPPRVGTGSTLSSSTINARELAFPSTVGRTRRILTTAPWNTNPIGLYVYRCYLQACCSISPRSI